MRRLLLLSALSWAASAAPYECITENDFCNSTDTSYGCTPYAGTPTGPWGAVRQQLIESIWGTPELPTRAVPDYMETYPVQHHFGNCRCLATGACPPSNCSAEINITKIVWTMHEKDLVFNSTVYLTRNSSGIAPSTVPAEGPVVWPQFPSSVATSDTLVIYHNGHDQPCDTCDTDHGGVVDYFNQLGFDTINMQMPLYQCNYNATIGCKHEYFQDFQNRGYKTFRFFLEPVVLTVNYAKAMGYKNIFMSGYSGGGWTTTLMAGIDPRLNATVSVAGSVPCDFRHSAWDFEQFCDNSWALACNYTCLYVLGGLEPHRAAVQVMHEEDPCCYHGCGRHGRIEEYTNWVRGEVAGSFGAVVTVGNVHEVNERDKVIASVVLD
eukprot:gene7514-11508_t